MAVISKEHTLAIQCHGLILIKSHIIRLFGVPHLEQVVKCPLNAPNSSFLILQRIFPSECMRANHRPIAAPVEIKEVNIGQEY